jgi:hypothetical protein
MALELSYASQRSEVWTAYVKRWKAVLWKYHLAFVVLSAVFVASLAGFPATVTAWSKGVALGLFICGIFALWPQIKFKPQTRSIRFDQEGFSTGIGSLTGKVSWTDVASIEDETKLVLIVGKNQNVMVIPDRAFFPPSARYVFLDTVRTWHEAKITA